MIIYTIEIQTVSVVYRVGFRWMRYEDYERKLLIRFTLRFYGTELEDRSCAIDEHTRISDWRCDSLYRKVSSIQKNI